MSFQSKEDPANVGPVRRGGWFKENSHFFTFVGTCVAVIALCVALLVYFKLQPKEPPTITADQFQMLKDTLVFATLVIVVKVWQWWRSGRARVGPKREVEAPTNFKEPNVRPGSLVVLEGWKEADKIICSAKHSLVIVDSFFHNQIGDLPCWLDEATKNGNSKGLNVSIYMASPDHVFGAQRLREWECGVQVDAHESARIVGFKQKLDIPISEEDQREYAKFICKNVAAIRLNVANHGPLPKLYTYPTMVASRIFVIDNTDLIFGWFPLLGSNPGYSCCHLRIEGVEGPEGTLANRLLRQVDIIKGISKPWRDGH